MTKATCIIGMIFGVLFVVVFGLDLTPLKIPFGRPSAVMDIGFIVCGLILVYLSWTAKKDAT